MALVFVADPSATQGDQILGLIYEGKVDIGRRGLRARMGPVNRVYDDTSVTVESTIEART